MDAKIDEIGPGLYRISNYLSRAGGPRGLTFCEFLIDAGEPLLFHCGHRARFDAGRGALAKVLPPERLRWIGYSHVEADEAGALNDWLGAAPHATAFHGTLGCNVWLNDFASRPPRAFKSDETVDLGGKRVRFIATPHLPHGWDAGLLFEETTGTLFCSDLFAQPGEVPVFSDGDIVGPAATFEGNAHATSLTPTTAKTIRALAALAPRRLAIMHGPTYTGDCVAALHALADYYEAQLRAALNEAGTEPRPGLT
jgi:flavorubredoxin